MKASFLERLIPKKKRLQKLKQNILDYYDSLPPQDVTEDQKNVLGYLKSHALTVFPYTFTDKYNESDIAVILDKSVNLYYMNWEGKKLYYKNGSSKKKAQKYFNSLRLEQDPESPHRYLVNDFDVNEGDILADVGAAEGNFSLSVIEKVKHVYLFEPEQVWIKALEATFAPWQNKVTIVGKFVSDKSSLNTITLDEFLGNEKEIDFIKADVEGAEAQIIRGASKLIGRNRKLKIAITTYHRQEDAGELDSLLRKFGFSTAFSEGYMIFYYGRDNIVQPPYLRKAIIRAVKNQNG